MEFHEAEKYMLLLDLSILLGLYHQYAFFDCYLHIICYNRDAQSKFPVLELVWRDSFLSNWLFFNKYSWLSPMNTQWTSNHTFFVTENTMLFIKSLYINQLQVFVFTSMHLSLSVISFSLIVSNFSIISNSKTFDSISSHRLVFPNLNLLGHKN